MKKPVKNKFAKSVGKKLRQVAGRHEYRQEDFFRRPKLLRTPKVTLAEMMRAVNAADYQKALSVNIKSVKFGKDLKVKDKTFSTVVGRTSTDENGHHHIIRVCFEGEKLGKNTPVIVGCTCGRFKYFYEVANAMKGLSFVQKSNGEKPVITNPRMRVGVCGHIARVCGYIQRKQKTFVKKPPGTNKAA